MRYWSFYGRSNE